MAKYKQVVQEQIGVIYARYSSSGQRDESIEGQLRDCHAFAERYNIRIIEEYCDRARRVADIYVEKQQLVTAGLEQARRHLDDAVRSVDSILDETK